MHASVPQSATELNFYAASSAGPDSYQTTSSHNIGALAQSGIQEDDGFSGSLLYLAAQDGLDDVETKCVHKYCYVRATTEHPGLDAKVDVDAYCSLIIFLPTIYLLHFHSHFSSYNRSAILLISSILLLSFQRLLYQQRHYIHYHTFLHFQQQQQQQQ